MSYESETGDPIVADYLISRYHSRVQAAVVAKEEAIAAATRIWNDAIAEIIGRWQGEVAAASLELAAAMDHRNAVYVFGPPPAPEPPAEPPALEPPAPDESAAPPLEPPPRDVERNGEISAADFEKLEATMRQAHADATQKHDEAAP